MASGGGSEDDYIRSVLELERGLGGGVFFLFLGFKGDGEAYGAGKGDGGVLAAF